MLKKNLVWNLVTKKSYGLIEYEIGEEVGWGQFWYTFYAMVKKVWWRVRMFLVDGELNYLQK